LELRILREAGFRVQTVMRHLPRTTDQAASLKSLEKLTKKQMLGEPPELQTATDQAASLESMEMFTQEQKADEFF